jgi:hypothetical protein
MFKFFSKQAEWFLITLVVKLHTYTTSYFNLL